MTVTGRAHEATVYEVSAGSTPTFLDSAPVAWPAMGQLKIQRLKKIWLIDLQVHEDTERQGASFRRSVPEREARQARAAEHLQPKAGVRRRVKQRHPAPDPRRTLGEVPHVHVVHRPAPATSSWTYGTSPPAYDRVVGAASSSRGSHSSSCPGPAERSRRSATTSPTSSSRTTVPERAAKRFPPTILTSPVPSRITTIACGSSHKDRGHQTAPGVPLSCSTFAPAFLRRRLLLDRTVTPHPSRGQRQDLNNLTACHRTTTKRSYSLPRPRAIPYTASGTTHFMTIRRSTHRDRPVTADVTPCAYGLTERNVRHQTGHSARGDALSHRSLLEAGADLPAQVSGIRDSFRSSGPHSQQHASARDSSHDLNVPVGLTPPRNHITDVFSAPKSQVTVHAPRNDQELGLDGRPRRAPNCILTRGSALPSRSAARSPSASSTSTLQRR